MRLCLRQKQMLIAFSILCFSTINSPFGHSEETIEDLLKIEAKVQQTVSKAMPAVVAVTDGQGFGSGVIVSKDGLVLTAGHVMASPFSSGYEIIFPDGRRVKARPLGKNLNVDAGMVQIVEPGPYPFVDVAKQVPQPGEWVVTMGHSGGYDIGRKPPVRTGRVLNHRDHQLVTDAVLIGGDSGGPLFNLNGEVIGIHSSIGDSIAENRHVSVSTFRQHWTRMTSGEAWGTLPELEVAKKKRKKRARMGIVVDRDSGTARVKSVHADSPAAQAGIQVGDIITRLDNNAVADADQLIRLIQKRKPGQGVNVEVQRNGLTFKEFITLQDF